MFQRVEYKTISHISVSHIYNLRHHNRQYNSSKAKWMHHTTATRATIGLRAKPRPGGKPGFQEFHSDNGSEFINHIVAKLLTKLYIRLTKSRVRHSNDNALVESKNGSVIRKLYGRNYLPATTAPVMNQFNRDYVNIYLNYHRPCGFAEQIVDARGKMQKKYNQWMTPYARLKSLDSAEDYLKPGITFAQLDQIAYAESDNQFAEKMRNAQVQLFTQLRSFI